MTAAVLIAAGLLRLGAVSDLVSKPVMTGFLFGLGMTITIGELADALNERSIELRLASVRAPAVEVLRRAGLLERVKVVPTLDAATHMTKGASP